MNAAAKKIIVPIDGSAASLRALDAAVEQADREGADLHLINIQPALPSGVTKRFVNQEAALRYRNAEANDRLAEAKRLLKSRRKPFTVATEFGEPAQVIAGLADGGDEIVMPARGMTFLNNLMPGHLAKKVMHATHAPVRVVH